MAKETAEGKSRPIFGEWAMHGSGAALSDGDGGALHAALYLASRRSEEERTSTNPARARGARRLSIIGRMRRSSITTTAAPGEASSGRNDPVVSLDYRLDES